MKYATYSAVLSALCVIAPCNTYAQQKQKEALEAESQKSTLSAPLMLTKSHDKQPCISSYCSRIAGGMCLAIMFFGSGHKLLGNLKETHLSLQQQLNNKADRLISALHYVTGYKEDTKNRIQVARILHKTVSSLANRHKLHTNEELLTELSSCYITLLPEMKPHPTHSSQEHAQEVTNVLLHIASELDRGQNNPTNLANTLQQLIG